MGIAEGGVSRLDPATQAKTSVSLATEYALSIAKEDGHWIGEIKGDVSITAQHIFFLAALERNISDAPAYRTYILSTQQEDGGWSLAPFCPGDVSISVEAYPALRILGMSPDEPEMVRAKACIRRLGGVANSRVFTRIFLALLGLIPWIAVPELLAETILLPSALNVIASWARTCIVPLFIIRHHRHVYDLPNGLSKDCLDQLWLDPTRKNVPYAQNPRCQQTYDMVSIIFSAMDSIMHWLGGLRKQPLRPYALKQCVSWILEHQHPEGDFSGGSPSLHYSLLALILEGYTPESDEVRRGIEAIERLTVQDEGGKRLQCTVSPVWDTVHMTRTLCDVGLHPTHGAMQLAIRWIKSRQILCSKGDWCNSNPSLAPGGFCFQYFNSICPDIDDTAAAILALISHDPEAVRSTEVIKAANWICGLQNRDGGWGAFESGNDKLWLNKIPFNDMGYGALADPSTPDVTGRVIEAFGLMLRVSKQVPMDGLLSERISKACEDAIDFLAKAQHQMGHYFGRWGVNYIYGTSSVLGGLQYFAEGHKEVRSMVSSATSWLKQVQNADGGWGEDVETYRHVFLAGRGPSTPSQTAWGLMAILTNCSAEDEAVRSAVLHLTRTQTDAGTWNGERFTGTGFPNSFYMGYSLYSHYFPLMALGRYIKCIQPS